MYAVCVCSRRNIQNENETINAFRITHKHLRSIKCQMLLLRLLPLLLRLPLLLIVVVRCGMNVLHRMTSHCVVLCLLSPSLLYHFCTHWLLFLSLILHLPLCRSSFPFGGYSTMCFCFDLVCLFHLFISSTCVVVVIKLITLNLYAGM